MFEVFGPDIPLAAKFFVAFAVVLALIGLTAWLVRRFGSNRLGGNARGRQPRLAVIDAATVDGRRRLVLIRRDNVEHLLMIGGPTDVVIEPNIVRAMSAASREPARAPEAMGRQALPADNAWPLQLTNEPNQPARHRAPPPEESWPAAEPVGRGRANDTLSGLAAELTSRLTP
ncbi:MAG: flagellar biosynthetic protein FliO, partial [Pseudolabrys sp.]